MVLRIGLRFTLGLMLLSLPHQDLLGWAGLRDFKTFKQPIRRIQYITHLTTSDGGCLSIESVTTDGTPCTPNSYLD